jgi:hypothetical protein
VAWEWKVPLPEVNRWPYTDFVTALHVLTEARVGVPQRAAVRHEDAGVDKLKKALG